MEITVAGKQRQVLITYKRMKNIVLRLNLDGSLRIHCPRFCASHEILKFILSKEKWILRTEILQERRAEINEVETSAKHLFWLGKSKQIEYRKSDLDYAYISGDTIVFCMKDFTSKRMIKVFRRFATETLEEFIKVQRSKWDEEICIANHLEPPTIQFRYMTSRWGVCSISKNRITMSLRLIHYPPESFAYVLLHEYVHFLVPNHSTQFYDMIHMWMPEYKLFASYLKG